MCDNKDTFFSRYICEASLWPRIKVLWTVYSAQVHPHYSLNNSLRAQTPMLLSSLLNLIPRQLPQTPRIRNLPRSNRASDLLEETQFPDFVLPV